MDHAQEEATIIMKQGIADAPPAESTPAEAQNSRLLSLNSKHAALSTTLSALRAERAALTSNTRLPSGLDMPLSWTEEEKTKHALESANAVIKEHIRLLHAYNEVKDVGQGLMGLVAEGRGVRVKEVMKDLGVGEKD